MDEYDTYNDFLEAKLIDTANIPVGIFADKDGTVIDFVSPRHPTSWCVSIIQRPTDVQLQRIRDDAVTALKDRLAL